MNHDKIQPDAPTHTGTAVARDTDLTSEVWLTRNPESGNWRRVRYIDEWNPDTLVNTYEEEQWLYRLTDVREVTTRDLMGYWLEDLATANRILVEVQRRINELEKNLDQVRESLS